MSQAHTDCRWGVLGHSQRGVSHLRQNLPNQDAIMPSLAADGLPPVILAVADGHGSAKSFRSDVGARLAVETAVEVCRKFLDNTRGTDLSARKTAAERGVPAEIFRDWRRRVEEHFQANPFTEAELGRLVEQAGPAARQRAGLPDQRPVAYGSTLLVAVVAEEFLLCFQLGDGDILAVSDTGLTERVIPKDEALIANETTSLCQEDGLRYMRCRFQLFQDRPPAMVLLSTDGYANSFAHPDAFLKVGGDYFAMLSADGAEQIEKDLPGWLEDTSCNGSGDDITVGIIYRRQPPLGKAEGSQTETESSPAGKTSGPAGQTKATSDSSEAAPPASPVGPREAAQSQVATEPEARHPRTLGNAVLVAAGGLTGTVVAFILAAAYRVFFGSPLAAAIPEEMSNAVHEMGRELLGQRSGGRAVWTWVALSVGAILGGFLFAWATRKKRLDPSSQGPGGIQA